MSANRIINAREDARNPRTAGRHLPAGILKPLEVGGMAAGGAGNILHSCLATQPPGSDAGARGGGLRRALFFRQVLHVAVQFDAGSGPVHRSFRRLDRGNRPTHVAAGAADLCGDDVAGGFETIYGSMDFDFDRANRINSIAARFGVRNAIRTTRVLHSLAAAALLALGIWMGLNVFYFIGWAIAVVLLVYENNMVKSGEPAMVGKAFAFNKYISSQLLAFTILAVALPFSGFFPW